jgi:hypothetical protein
MNTAQTTFVVERCGGTTGSHVTRSDVTGRDPDRKLPEVCCALARLFRVLFFLLE